MYIIFTGKGKGKTTAALGHALRALGNRKKVLMVQFIKGPWESGEDISAQMLSPLFKIVKTGKGFVGILNDQLPWSEHEHAAKEGVKYAKKEIQAHAWDTVILDEIHVAIALRLLTQKDLDDLVKTANKCGVHIIATGREAAKEQIAKADLVTEMCEIKHPYSAGAAAMRGVEF